MLVLLHVPLRDRAAFHSASDDDDDDDDDDDPTRLPELLLRGAQGIP